MKLLLMLVPNLFCVVESKPKTVTLFSEGVALTENVSFYKSFVFVVPFIESPICNHLRRPCEGV